MRLILLLSLALSLALSSACVGGSTGSTGTLAATDGTAGDGAAADSGGGSATGDASKNNAQIQAKDPAGATTKVEATAAPDPAKATIFGAANADKLLQIYIADATGTTIVATIDTAVHPLPKKGIPVTAANGAAWVVYTSGGAVLTSKDSGTIDIDGCPTKQGEVVLGAFKGVVVANELPVGPASLTLDGPFNLVYQGGAGAVACTPPTTGGGGGGDLGSFGKPQGATCNANPCDGGGNTTRNCCPYVPCVEPCIVKCGTDVETCSLACPPTDFSCPFGCIEKFTTCYGACLTTCNVSASCKASLEALQGCESNAACDTGSEAGDDACSFDACCNEWKAAF